VYTAVLVAVLIRLESTTGVKPAEAVVKGILVILVLMFGLVVLGISLAVYFLPTIVALTRNHPNTAPILIVNLVFGWTLIGYVVALAWSFTAIERK
jgi:hypothetical protein